MGREGWSEATPGGQPTADEILERIFATTELLIAYLDRDLRFLRVNRAYAEADGTIPERLVGKEHFALYPNSENEAIFRRVLETGRPYVAHAKPFHHGGHPERGTTYWDWTVQPVRALDGTACGLVLTLADVTEREGAVRAVRQSERRYRSLFEDAPIAMFEEDLSDVKRAVDALRARGEPLREVLERNPDEVVRIASLVKIKDVNRAALALFGASDKSRFRRDLRPFAVRETYDVLREETLALAEGEQALCHEIKTRTLAGDVRTVSLGLILPDVARDTWDDVIVSFVDVTDREEADARREKVLEELQASLARVRTLSGLLPICASCKKIRDDRGCWSSVERYFSEHADVKFTHGLCPACEAKLYPE